MISSTFRLLMRSGSLMKPMLICRPLTLKPSLINFGEKRKFNLIPRRWSHVHYTYPMIESRVMLLLRLFDKINPNSVTLDSKFVQELGLDSLDIVEITAACEDEFWTEIPDCDSDHFQTPRHIIQYLCDKYDVYEHIKPVSAGKEYLEEAKVADDRAHH
jgi:NADH dehydrogenase (ubiquinone) 1 alpha/beta subcomplex 1